MTLRSYQKQDVKNILKAWESNRRVLYVLSTGAGKTVVAVKLILDIVSYSECALVLAHRTELIDQVARKLVDSGLDPDEIGFIKAGREENPWAPVQIASVQSLRGRKKPSASLVVVDEAHRAPADTYQLILAEYPRAAILGLTATAIRMDGKPLGELFDVIVEGPKPSVLSEAGFISSPQVWTKPNDEEIDLKGVRRAGGDYNLSDLEGRVNRPYLLGNQIEHYMKRAGEKPTIWFGTTVRHAETAKKAWSDAGIPCEVVHGGTPAAERARILGPDGDLATGKLKAVMTCMVVSEGFDLPQIKCAILARPTRSLVVYLQQCGRIVRPYRNWKPIILDHSGNALRHGLPDDDREWSLEGGVRGKDGNGEPPCKKCPECGLVCPAGTAHCPECSNDFGLSAELEEREGELVELRRQIDAERERLVAVVRKLGKPMSLVEDLMKARFGDRA